MTSKNGQASAPPTGLIAVIGVGCVLPDAANPTEYWENLRNGRSSIREVPQGRWDASLYFSNDRTAPDRTYTKIGAFITGFKLNPVKFRIPPSVLKQMDESHQWALESAAQALADAGLDKKDFDRSRCAVILGNAMGGETRVSTTMRLGWPLARRSMASSPVFRTLPPGEQQRALQEAEIQFTKDLPEITEDTMPGELSNTMAGRIANVFNLTGKNFTTDAACASSLAAFDAAIKALEWREADLVITGGFDRSMDVATYVKFCKIGALSAEGSFPFDARADGFVMGEGGAIFILKRYEDAVRDGDRIRAVIRGVGSSSDGRGKGITAPNLDGQLKAIQRALEDAQVRPTEIDLVECHGTSTKVGDAVEIQALTRIFGPTTPAKQSIPIGSVKSNFGHLKSAAGAASLLKIVLALEHKTLPPSLNFRTPNPSLRFDETPFYVLTSTRPWPEPPAGRPRRAGISSFGFGGTNFHLVVEEYAPSKNTPRVLPHLVTVPTPPPSASTATSVLLKSTPHHRALEPLAPNALTDVLLVAADSRPGLGAELVRVKAELGHVAPGAFANYLQGQNQKAAGRAVRVACVVESPTDAAAKVGQVLDAVGDPKKLLVLAAKGIHVGEGPLPGKVAFLFPGQGSQYADMLRDLSSRFESVKRTVEQADQVMVPLVGKPLTASLFTDDAAGRRREHVEEELKRTEITQPAVLTADTALLRLLADYGVRPDLVAGHSLGEYGALIAAGVLTFEDAVLAVSARGREMAAVKVPDLGKMASVSADPATVETKLKAIPGYVIPANKNCKVQTVIAGASVAVEQAVQMFNAQGIQSQLIPVSAAFHSAIVAPATEPLKRVVERLDIREPKVPVLSNVHADYYPKGASARAAIVDLLGRQVAAPVEWQRQTERMHHDGARIFIEVGPKSVLTTFVRNILEGRPHSAVATNHPKRGGFFHFFDAIAHLAAQGYPVRFPKPTDANVHLPAFRETVAPSPTTAPSPSPAATATVPATGAVTRLAFPNLEQAAEDFIRQKQDELRHLLVSQLRAATPTPAPADEELVALKRKVESFGLNLEPILITGVSVGTPGTQKRLFDDRNFERILAGENAIEPLSQDEMRQQVEKNVVRLVKSDTGDHRFEAITDVAEVIKLAAKKGAFDLEKDYALPSDFVAALDISSKMAIAAGIEALHDAQIPLVRGYVKTTTGKFLPGEWALPEPLQEETGIVFASAFPGYANLVDQLSRSLADRYGRKPYREVHELYRELTQKIRDPEARAALEAWYERNRRDIESAVQADVYQFSRRFLVQVLSMGHSQLAQLVRARGPNTQVNAACASTTLGIALAEDWIRMGRCKRVLVVGADDVTNEALLPTWTAGFLAAGAATTKGDVREAALPFDKRRHGMIIGSGAVGIVVEAESVVKQRGMEGITEILATVVANSAYHITRLDTEHIARVMDRLLAAAEKRHGVSRAEMAPHLLFMSHETYTPARGGSAAAEIAALKKAFGPDVSKVVVANTKGFTGHPQGASIEDAIAIRCVQLGRAPPIANLQQPDPELGDIRLSRGGQYDLKYGLRLAAGFGSQVAMMLMRLRSRDLTRIVDRPQYLAWVARVSGSKGAELEVAHRTLRVKSHLPLLAESARPPIPDPPRTAPSPAPRAPPRAPAPPPLAADRAAVLERVVQLVAEKTGYSKDMLDPDLELEADLGIDTVKQAELFGHFREAYQLPRDETLQLKDYPTLHKIADYILSRSSGATPAPTAPAPAPAAGVPTPPGPRREDLVRRLTTVVAEKTGYSTDLLEPDLDLEADLGIDTVKQAEIFGLIRSDFNLPRDDAVQIKDLNTLNRIADYFVARSGAAGTAPATSPPTGTITPSPPKPAAPMAPAPARERGPVLDRIRQLVADRTGYPIDLLEPDLDLEADLGIDTVKQAEMFGIIRDTYGIVRLDGLQLKDYNTLNKLADFILQGSQAAPAPAPTAPGATPEPEVAPLTPTRPGTAPAGAAGVLDRVRALVAEKTGYPVDMLDPDLDLEADLGIDTVKQAEMFGHLRDTFGIARVDGVQLKDYNTLNKLAQFLTAQAPQAASAPVPTPPAPPIVRPSPPPAPLAPAAVAAPTASDRSSVLHRVRQMVADKTGYPIDLLEPDLDLEADLGIDTVKQAEMFGHMRDAFGLPRVEGIQLKDYNTLSKLADFVVLQSAAPAPAPPTASPAVQIAPVVTAESTPSKWSSRRYLVRYVALPASPTDPAVVQGKTLLVWAPSHHRADLLHTLKQAGAAGVALDALPLTSEEAQNWVEAQRRRTPRINGVVFVPMPNPAGPSFEDEDARVVKSFFYLLKAVLSTAKTGEVDLIAAATFLGGDYALSGTAPVNPIEGAVAGFVKAIARELPSANVKCVDFPHGVSAPTLAQDLVEEMGRRDGVVEVGTAAGRGTLKLLEQETVEEEPGIDLASSDVVLVSGGGAGITSDVVKRLAPSGATFVLLGRTSLRSDAAQYVGFTEQAWNGKRIELQAEMKAKGERVTPVAVEKRMAPLRKAAEIHQTLDALRTLGAQADYHALDVTDRNAVTQLVKVLRTTVGPVTGILHAAGLEESKLIVDKTSDSFDRVFDVKVLGARNLVDATAGDPLRFFLAFTSIAGRFGNAGQADYSAANDALAKLCHALRRERGTAFAATAMDWTAWGDKGMATRGSVMAVLREAGVTALPLEEGVARFAAELAHGCQEAEVLIAGELGRLAPPNAFTRQGESARPAPSPRPTPPRPLPAGSGGQQVLLVDEGTPSAQGNLVTGPVSHDGRTATASFQLDPSREPYLKDHAVDGVPYLPGVFGQEAFAEVAHRLAPGLPYLGARDVEFRLPAKVLRDRPLQVTVVASVASESPDYVEVGCRLQSLFTNAKGERMGAPRIHFTATLLFGRPAPQPPTGPGAGPDLHAIVEKRDIYRSFFHGPSFQVLDRVGFTEDGRTAIGLWADPRAPLLRDRRPEFVTNPMMRELGYQTAGAFELFRHGFLSLPKAEARLKVYRNVPASTAVRAFATLKGVRGDTAHFDVVAVTADDNQVLFEIDDFQLIRVRPLEGTTPPAAEPSPATTVYKARWGHDLPLPLTDAAGVWVRQGELERLAVTQEEALTSGERSDQARYRNEQRAREFFAGRLAAKEAIAQVLGRPLKESRGIEIRRLETGEPQARGAGLENILVSITHTGDLGIAVAARRGPKLRSLGIDAERVEAKPPSFETEAFAEAERHLLDRLAAQGQDRAELVVRFWAVKESVLKALGKGFALDLHDVQVTNLSEDEFATVDLRAPAQHVLHDLGAQAPHVQTWTRDGVAYALAWTEPRTGGA